MTNRRIDRSGARCIAASARVALMALAALLAGGARAQDPPAEKPPEKPAPEKPAQDKSAPDKPAAEKLTAWPKPADKDQVLTDIERVVKAHIPEMATAGHDALIATGTPAVPLVLERYGREKNEEVAERLREVLMGITNADQTRLLAKEFESKHLPARVFALQRVAAFPDPGVKAQAEKAWARIAKQADKADADERFAAGLATASSGSIVGLDALFEACTGKRWDKGPKEIRTALEGCRGVPAGESVLKKLENADRKTKVAVLRMLAGCGDASQAARLRGFLDDEDNTIRVSTINALRGMVDDQQPIEGLSAFESVEMCKAWKERKL